MHKAIILSSCLVSSAYLFSKSVECVNDVILENKKIPHKLIVINSLVFVMSGFAFICSLRSISKIVLPEG